MEIQYIGVVGAGTMGHGIAQVAAQAGYYVLVYDSVPEVLVRARQRIETSLAKFALKGQITELEKNETLARLRFTDDLSEFSDVDLLIEAIVEDEETKKNIFRELDRIVKKECIFASNTSSISISHLASSTERADRFIGMHFMNPPQLVPLLEVIMGDATSDHTVATVRSVAKTMGRAPMIESRDHAGFVANRILMPAINEAAKLVESKVATPEDVDCVIIMGVGSSKSMQILQLADLIGIDVCVNVLEVIAQEFGPYYEPTAILKQMVREGRLGRKTGRGFFSYEKK